MIDAKVVQDSVPLVHQAVIALVLVTVILVKIVKLVVQAVMDVLQTVQLDVILLVILVILLSIGVTYLKIQEIKEKLFNLDITQVELFLYTWFMIKIAEKLGGNYNGKFIIKTHSEKISKRL